MNVVTKITFPGDGPGIGKIRVYLDGKLSGPPIIVGDWVRASPSGATWAVHLYSQAGRWTGGDETVYPRTLAELREQLLERIKRDGPWWR